MDVHIGREQVTSWKDFAVRYLLIVAGILSAWAVNQWNESRQHARIAEQTRQALQAELRADLDELAKALAFNSAELRKLAPLRNELFMAVQRGTPAAQIEAGPLARWDGAVRQQLPGLRRDAWDAAVAGQAVTHLDAAELRRYSAAYAALRLVDGQTPAQDGGVAGELRRRYTQWQLDRQLGRLDTLELVRLLLLWESAGQYNLALWQGVESELGIALGQPERMAQPGVPASAPAR
jgi:hypothetical protein